jgi:hypothetical protein
VQARQCDMHGHMSSLEEHAKHRQREIAAEIAELGLCPPGAIVERRTRCGKPTCRCHSDPDLRHGPYPSWIRKVGTKTLTRTLSDEQYERYAPLFDNTRRLRALLTELEILAAEVLDHAERRHDSQPRTRRQSHP